MVSLKADQQFTFMYANADEALNPLPLAGPPPVFTVDSPEILTLTDNGDATGVVAATGRLGTATLSVDGTTDAGVAYHEAVAIDVVAGDAVGATFSFGPPTEVTPDT